MVSAAATVSIVTVTYNSATTLADTLASVAAQSHPHIQHILVDGGSSDGTVAMIEAAARRDARVIWVSEPDAGIYDAMNKGIRLATGDVVGMLNSDDFLVDAEVVADLVAQLAREEADAIYADLEFVETTDPGQVVRIWTAGRGRMSRGWVPPHPTLYVRREAYERLGPYRADFAISADYDFMLRLFTPGAARVAYLPRSVVRMRTGGASTNGLRSNVAGFREAGVSLAGRYGPAGLVVNALRVARKLPQLRPGHTYGGHSRTT